MRPVAYSVRTDGNATVLLRAVVIIIPDLCVALDRYIVNGRQLVNTITQFGNRLVICDINLTAFDTVLNCLSVSCDGESFIRCCYIKGNSFAVFDVLFCCIATRCFQLPRTHDAVSAFGNTEVFFQLFHVQRVGDVSVRIDS